MEEEKNKKEVSYYSERLHFFALGFLTATLIKLIIELFK